MRSLIIVVILIIIIIIKMVSDTRSPFKIKPGGNLDPFSAFSVPVYLIRAHTARFSLMCFKPFDIIKDMYVEFLIKYRTLQEGDENYELMQLKYLIDHKIELSKTIEKGKKEAHKNRLLILIFLFNIAAVEGKISKLDEQYLNHVYKDLGIAYHVYKTIRDRYIRDDFASDGKDLSNYKLKLAFKTLQLPEHSKLKDAKTAYRRLAKKYHPDVLGNGKISDNEYTEGKFLEITEAYELIKTHFKA